jgi:hypothetical protein
MSLAPSAGSTNLKMKRRRLTVLALPRERGLQAASMSQASELND